MRTHRTKKTHPHESEGAGDSPTYRHVLFCVLASLSHAKKKLPFDMPYHDVYVFFGGCRCVQPTNLEASEAGTISSDFFQSWKLPYLWLQSGFIIESWLSSEPEVTWNMFLYVPTTHTSCTSCLFSTLHFKFNKPFKMCGKLWGSRLLEEAQSKLVSGDIKVLKSLGL